MKDNKKRQPREPTGSSLPPASQGSPAAHTVLRAMPSSSLSGFRNNSRQPIERSSQTPLMSKFDKIDISPDIYVEREHRQRTRKFVSQKQIESALVQVSDTSIGRVTPALRVLIYTACYNVLDGVTLTIRKLEQEILSAGGHVCIVSTSSGSKANTHLIGEHANRSILFLDNSVSLPFDKSYQLGLKISNEIREKVFAFDATVVHLTVPDLVGLDIIEYARDNDIPLMGTYHSNLVDYMDHYGLFWLKPLLVVFFRHNYNFLQSLYSPTPFIVNHLSKPPFNLHKCTDMKVWGRGIDLEKFSPGQRSEAFRHRLGILPHEVVVTFVGRFVLEKRPDIFANVVRRLVSEGVSFKALVVGTGLYEDEMKKLPNTICTGWMNADNLPVVYASSDIFLFPSAVETFGNVTLEAAASGLPLVVDSGCSGHLALNGYNGFACPTGDEDAFFRATRTLINSHQTRKEYSRNSREHSLKFEQKSVVREMLSNYNEVIDEFHVKYGGIHSNRDKEWVNPDSFQMGQVVWPFSLRFCISLIFPVVQIFYSIYEVVDRFKTTLYNSMELASRSLQPRRVSLLRNRQREVVRAETEEDVELGEKKSLVNPALPLKTLDATNVRKKTKVSRKKRSPSAAPKGEIRCVRVFIEGILSFALLNLRIQSSAELFLRRMWNPTKRKRKNRHQSR